MILIKDFVNLYPMNFIYWIQEQRSNMVMIMKVISG